MVRRPNALGDAPMTDARSPIFRLLALALGALAVAAAAAPVLSLAGAVMA